MLFLTYPIKLANLIFQFAGRQPLRPFRGLITGHNVFHEATRAIVHLVVEVTTTESRCDIHYIVPLGGWYTNNWLVLRTVKMYDQPVSGSDYAPCNVVNGCLSGTSNVICSQSVRYINCAFSHWKHANYPGNDVKLIYIDYHDGLSTALLSREWSALSPNLAFVSIQIFRLSSAYFIYSWVV